MTKDYLVVLDACVLVGAGLRDTLLRLAETPRLYVPKWSDDIMGELEHTLQHKVKRTKTEAQTKHLVAELQKAFPEAWVEGYKSIRVDGLPDENDLHVVAAAIKSGAQTIVTFNLKHFKQNTLRPLGLESVHPDEFLVNQFYLDDALVTKKLTEQARTIDRTLEQQLQAFKNTRELPLFTQTVASALSITLVGPNSL